MSAEDIAEIEQDAAETADPQAPAWQTEFRLRENLTQQDIYAYEIELNKLGDAPLRGAVVVSNHALKAAIAAGWLAAPAVGVLPKPEGGRRFLLAGEDVDLVLPGKLIWYGRQISRVYFSSLTIPPN